MKEGNLNAALLGSIFPWGKIKEESFPPVCVSQAVAPSLKQEASFLLNREGGMAEQTLHLLLSQDFESLTRLVHTLPTPECLFDGQVCASQTCCEYHSFRIPLCIQTRAMCSHEGQVGH